MKPTIAGLMVLVLACGVAVAALKNASEAWAGVLLSLTLLMLSTSLVAVLNRREAKRAFWQGFAIFGWGYLLLAMAPWFAEQVAPKLPTTALLSYVHERINPTVKTVTGTLNMDFSANVSGAPMVIQLQSPGGPGTPSTAPVQSGMIVWYVGNSVQFQRVGHSLFVLLAAYLGGLIGRWLHRSNHAATM